MRNFDFSPEHPLAFGDPFLLEELPLPRPADGYGVQYLGKDELLDRRSADFLSIRNPALRGIFPSFAAAQAAARRWCARQDPRGAMPALAIVPVAWDSVLTRHILIYGVLQPELPPYVEAVYLPR
ncbi:MAG: hypothetical protein N3C59_04985 [Azovibrio sp.]|nr:hypothetical protein [Azovibrio sp.]